MKRLRVLIGDDHTLLLNGIEALLKPHYEVVGSVTDGRALVEAALRLHPDLVVLDVSMPQLNGFEAAKRIKESLPSVKLIFLSMHTHPMYLRKAIEAGANGYVLKTGVIEELLEAAGQVMAGKTWFSPGFGPDVLADLLARRGKPAHAEVQELTGRQREILQLIVEGRLNKEIAHILGISIKTVDFHRGRMMARLGVHSTAELVRVAIEQGLIPPSASNAAGQSGSAPA